MINQDSLIRIYREILKGWDRKPLNGRDAKMAFEFSKDVVQASRLYNIPLTVFYQPTITSHPS